MKAGAAIIFLILLTVWAGVIIGVSLIATPIKFQAPSLTLQTGAEIGRYTFRFLTRIELCFLIAALITATIAQPRWITIAVLAPIVIEIVVQRYWLLPVLDNRVAQRLAGQTPEFSFHHTVYAAMEAIKAALLIAGAAVEYRSRLF
jgi:hypothetical protein